MKKILVFLFLMAIGTSVYAQKSYVTLYVGELASTNGQFCYLTGDVPTDMEKHYSSTSSGNILNLLSARGYEVELMTGTSTQSSSRLCYLLSKKKSPNESDAIQHIYADDDAETYEVARYNLQGLPINKDEKGVQIVVYSNYTTKTIIVE